MVDLTLNHSLLLPINGKKEEWSDLIILSVKLTKIINQFATHWIDSWSWFYEKTSVVLSLILGVSYLILLSSLLQRIFFIQLREWNYPSGREEKKNKFWQLAESTWKWSHQQNNEDSKTVNYEVKIGLATQLRPSICYWMEN